MSTHAITSPPVPRHHTRTWGVAAIALVVGLAAGAGIVTVTRSDSSTSSRSSTLAAPAVNSTTTVCLGDGGVLLAEMTLLPTAQSSRIASEVSPTTLAMLRSAALMSAATLTMPTRPDPTTLERVLSRLDRRDATAIMSGLTPETRAQIGSVPTSAQACTSPSPAP